MKKILLSIGTLLLMFGVITKVEAKSYSILLNGNNTFEDEITLTLQINNQKDMGTLCNGICGLMTTLKYDGSKIELIKINGLNDFEITHNEQDGTIIIERDNGVKDGTNIGTFKFKNKSLKNDESTLISLVNLTGTDGDSDIKSDDVSKSIKYVKKVNNNVSSSQTNNNKQETVVKKSSNNNLSSIVVNGKGVNLIKDKYEYDITVVYEVDNVNIEATLEDSKASVTGDGMHELIVGENNIKLLVKAEDGSQKEYKLNITRDTEDLVVEDIIPEVDSETKEETSNSKTIYIVIGISAIILVVGGFLIFRKK